MKTCNQIQKLIYPYLDGELEGRENRLVEEHILTCQECSDILQEQKRFLMMLENASLREKGSAALEARVLHSLERRQTIQFPWLAGWGGRAALVAVVCGLVLLVVFPFFPRKDSLPSFIRASVGNHRDFVQGRASLSIVNSDTRVVSQWLSEQIGFTYDFPEVDGDNVVLIGGRVEKYKDLNVGLVNYSVHDEPVTLVVVRKTPQTGIETENFSYVKDRRINFSQAEGFNVVSWSVNANNFALVSRLPQKGKSGCAVCHADGSGLIDLSEFYSRT